MPSLPVPDRWQDVLRQPNPAVLACIRPDGTPLTAAVWYLWDDERVLLTFDRDRVRLRFIRQNPAVSLTVLDGGDWFRNLSLFGRVVELHDDEGLRHADRLAQHYVGHHYPGRERPRVFGWMDVDRYFAWDAHAEVEIEAQGLR